MKKIKITLVLVSEVENLNVGEAVNLLSDFGDVKVVDVELTEEKQLDGTRS